MSLGVFLVFDWGVFELGRRNREQIGWLGDRHGGDLGTDLFGEENGLLDGFGGEIRPVSWDQDVLEHYSFLLSVFPSDDPQRRVGPRPAGTVAVRSASPESAADRAQKRPTRASTPPRSIA